MFKRISILFLLVFFSCSSPVLAAKHHKRHKHSRPSTENKEVRPVALPSNTTWYQRVHPSTNPVKLALLLAEHYWHTIPCDGRVAEHLAAHEPATVEIGEGRPEIEEGDLVAAWTRFDTPLGPMDYEASPLSFTECEIMVNARAWPHWLEDDFNFQVYCDEITHEVGHLLGHPDDGQTDPESIEYPVTGFPAPNLNSVPQCQHVVVWHRHERIVSY